MASRWGSTIAYGGWKRRTVAGDGRGVSRLRRRLGERRKSEERSRRGQRRRDQWTCAGVPRHHGDLLATSRNKMATLPFSIAERWRQSHVHLLLILFNRTCLTELEQILSPDGTVRTSPLPRVEVANFATFRGSGKTRLGNCSCERTGESPR